MRINCKDWLCIGQEYLEYCRSRVEMMELHDVQLPPTLLSCSEISSEFTYNET